MHANYVIQWKSKSNGRSGKGTKLLGLDEAERLASELNNEYPQIEHVAVPSSLHEPVPVQHAEGAKESSAEDESPGAEDEGE